MARKIKSYSRRLRVALLLLGLPAAILVVSSFFPFSFYRGALDLLAGPISRIATPNHVLYAKQLFDEVSSRFDYPAEILLNYGKSFFASRDIINVNMSQESYAQLRTRIELAQERGLINRADKDVEVNSALLFNNQHAYKAKIRLRGTWLDHAQKNKWSFRVKVKNKKTIYGMNRFSLHDPRTRMWLWEWLYHKALAYTGLMYLDYRFVDLHVNGKSWGVYALEEFMHFNLVEKNKRRDGVLLREGSFLFNQKKVAKDAKLKEIHNRYKLLFQKYSDNQITASTFYDTEKLAKHFAITQIFGSGHSHFSGNWITYFNPLTNKVEVIGYDSNSGRYLHDAKLQFEPGATFFFKDMHIEELFNDREFVKNYIFFLQQYSKPAYFEDFFSSISEQLDAQLKRIWRTKPWQTSQFYKDVIFKNQAYITEYLSRHVKDFKNIQSEEVDKFMEAHNMGSHNLNDVADHDIAAARDPADLDRVPFIDYDRERKIARIKEGAYTLSKDLIIPAGVTLLIDSGVTLNLDNSSSVVSYSPVEIQGTAEKNVRVIGHTTDCSFVVINAKDKSQIEHAVFQDLGKTKSNPFISGSVTFYESDVEIRSSVFAGNSGVDDHLNIIRSVFVIENTSFSDSFSDAIDIDFSEGQIHRLEIVSAGNDGLDFSNSTVSVSGLAISDIQDKAVSIGEQSDISISNAFLGNSKIGVAIKDSSAFFGEGIHISNTEYGYALYNKKPMYGMPKAEISKTRFTRVEQQTILERGSILNLNGKQVGTYSDVKKELQL